MIERYSFPGNDSARGSSLFKMRVNEKAYGTARAARPLGDGVACGREDVRECLQVAFRVAAGDASRSGRGIPKVRTAVARVNLVRLAILPHHHLVRVLLPPFQRGLGAVHLDEDVVL